MSAQLYVLKLVAIGTFSAMVFYLAYRLARVPAITASTLGSRGERRQRVLSSGGSFAAIEPMVRQVAAWVAPLIDDVKRKQIDRDLREAGYYLGLVPDELVALRYLTCIAFGAVGLGLGLYWDMPWFGVVVGSALGPLLLAGQVSENRNVRFTAVNRGLPTEIDLASMCLGAGMDFPGAIRLIVEQRVERDDVLRDELQHVLRELDLGHTRSVALRNLEARVPTESVREFVGAVVQAEEKGTPLAEVLRIQAGMLRMRRSILAEEAASRAGVLMMIPLVMLLGSILIILMGSMMIKTYESGMAG